MKKIRKIPPEIAATFPQRVRDAVADGLRCGPADRPRAEDGLRRIYKMAGLNPSAPIIWVDSPLVGALAASIARSVVCGHGRGDSAVHSAVYSAVGSAVHSAVGSAVHLAVHSAVDSAVGSAVNSAVGSAVHSAVDSAVNSARLPWHDRRGGQFWISWPAFVETIMALGVNHPSFEALRAEADVCRSAGWYWPNRYFIMVCERPALIKMEGGRLHCADGPCMDYGPTFQLFAWRGTAVPASWIMDRAVLTPKIALTWRNVEQRRAACEILGWHKILADLNATTIDIDDADIGTLVEVNLPDSGPERFLRVRCGTGREFALPVPREMRTALEAQSWTWGLTPKQFNRPEVRT